ncbi:MAG: RNA-binding S4 domain-containing protein [Eubacteriales bacterium]|nr:RNA-binding S4 domain-containing protein [Eubacteriales bacterium]
MRLDKFLKVSRLVKRRPVAKELADAGRVILNGRPAKAGSNLAVGDELELLFGSKPVKIKVLELRDFARKEEAETLYELIRD